MCGVPHHAAEGYIARLIQKGYRVAMCDQMEAPSVGQETGGREITRIVTPGTATERAWLALPREQLSSPAVVRTGERAGVAHVDVSTGEFRVTEIDLADVARGAREP